MAHIPGLEDENITSMNADLRAKGSKGVFLIQPRVFEAVRLPDDDYGYYDHRIHCEIPTAYVSGSLYSSLGVVERDGIYNRLKKIGATAVEVYFPIDLYKKGVDSFLEGKVSDAYFLGMSLTYLLSSNVCVEMDNAGIFSMAERALARLLEMPVITKKELEAKTTATWKFTKRELDKLQADKKSVLEHIIDLGSTVNLSRPIKPEEATELGQHTFWDYIKQFIDKPEVTMAFGNQLPKYRLRDVFGRESHPLFESKKAEKLDARPRLATIDGSLRIISMFDFYNDAKGNCQNFWYLNDSKKPVYCERITGTNDFREVPNKVWEDDH